MAAGNRSKAGFLTASLAGLMLAGCQEASNALAPDQVVGVQPSSAIEPCTDPATSEDLAQQLIDAINAERRKAGVGPLKRSVSLMAIADYYACRLIDGGFFDHVDPEGGSTVDYRAIGFGYAFAKIGENLAAGQTTVEEAMTNWMHSPKHRANMLDPAFTEIGVAVKDGGEYGRYWVQEIARPLATETESRPPPPTSQQTPPDDAASSQPANTPKK